MIENQVFHVAMGQTKEVLLSHRDCILSSKGSNWWAPHHLHELLNTAPSISQHKMNKQLGCHIIMDQCQGRTAETPSHPAGLCQPQSER